MCVIGAGWRAGGLTACLLAVMVATGGCGIPERGYGSRQFMQRAEIPSMQPPPGKALVLFYRPSTFVAGGLHLSLWDSYTFIGTTLGGQAIAYVCEPGERIFVGRCELAGDGGNVYFGEHTSAIRATLEADKVYDIYCESLWRLTIHLVKLCPVTRDEPGLRKCVPGWTRRQRWMTLSPPSPEKLALFEGQERQVMQKALASVEHAKLPRLGPEDAR